MPFITILRKLQFSKIFKILFEILDFGKKFLKIQLSVAFGTFTARAIAKTILGKGAFHEHLPTAFTGNFVSRPGKSQNYIEKKFPATQKGCRQITKIRSATSLATHCFHFVPLREAFAAAIFA